MSPEQGSIRLTPKQRLALQRASRQRGEAGVALRATIILVSTKTTYKRSKGKARRLSET